MEKGSKILIIILLLLVLGLGGYIIYDKIITKENEEITENEIDKDNTKENEVVETKEVSYTYQEIKGLYEGKSGPSTIHIYLEDDGTFVYVMSSTAYSTYLGNYIIENNQLKLNTIFWEGNGAGLGVSKEDQRLILLSINSDGSLTETQNNQVDRNEQITLTKIQTTDDYQSGLNNFYSKINNTPIYNNTVNN